MFKRYSLLLLLSVTLVHAEIKELVSMGDLCDPIADALQQEKLPLIVFDIDDTIATTEQDLGSSTWFYREIEKEMSKPGADKESAFRKVIALYIHLQAYLPLKAVEEETPTLIMLLQQLGIPCMALTARSLDTWCPAPVTLVERTFQQLEDLGIDLSVTALSETDVALSDNPLLPALYSRGIIFNGRNHKGETLLKYLAAIDVKPDMVIYVDDHASHVESVHTALVAAGIPCTSFHYSASDAYTKNFDEALAQQQLAAFLVEHPLVPAAA